MKRISIRAMGLCVVAASAVTLGVTGISYASGVTVSDLNNGATPKGMAESLAGGGVSISNVTYTGAERAAGTFASGASSIGFEDGIVLDSGKVQTYPTDPPCSRGVEGPNTCYESAEGKPGGPSGFENSTAFGTPGDAELTALSGFPTFDASILEFDFVPEHSTVQFSYVFGSEEYSDYANSPFNDVFAFSVNGTNCALVPGTSEPVSVNTINNGNDQGGDTTPHHANLFRDNVRPSPSIESQMDGLTTVLTCTATVKEGQKNHIKLAIADASDPNFDSAVFIQAGSLVSGTQISTSLTGGGQSGKSITVPEGTAVTDHATLTGANASKATGTVEYKVYSDSKCTVLAASAGTVSVTGGTVPGSNAETLAPGTYYWQASYDGDTNNNSSTSECGAETLTVAASDQPITASGTTVSATEGASFSGSVASFTDPDTAATASEYTATIEWGDSTSSTGTISGPTGGPFTVSGEHTYAEEGTYTVTVTITDVDNSSNTATATSTANVADAALASKCAAAATTTQAFAGPTATFTDADPNGMSPPDYSATINWGDSSSSSGTVSLGTGPGPYTVSGSHAYTSTGPFTITTTITDAGGSKTVATCKTLVFAFAPGGGSFVIGDKNAATGTAVTFWGAQWWKLNSLSGGSAPASFKGFALNPKQPACGRGWSTDPGNSTPPPNGPLPADMGVIVSSKITQSGSQISGNTVHIVVVKTNPGYQPDPGHPGTGTVEAQVC